ncbi:MAG: hypothetical protein JSU63_14375 [Phycisphaerales bacterium]|nr:MAG: hypothetical protein JSU63_14375 [Phycisphaerales bacterium]
MKAIEYLTAGILVLGILGFNSSTFGQFPSEMRWWPSSGDYLVEYDGSVPVITIDGVLTDPVWVTLTLELSGWGWPDPYSYELQAYRATINQAGYTSGTGDALVPSGGGPEPPYVVIDIDERYFVFHEYVSPSIPGCPIIIDGWPLDPWHLGASIAPCCVTDPIFPFSYGGTVTIKVPTGAAGWYQIQFLDYLGPALEPATFMLDCSGDMILPLTKRPVVIKVPMGRCCHSVGLGTTQCEDDVTETQCAEFPSPWTFEADASCSTGDVCVDCAIPDCDENGVADWCDLANCVNDPACDDCNGNDVPDGCEVPPIDPLAPDCQPNGVPDECELPPIDPDAPDCNGNSIPDGCEADCNDNGVADECEVPPMDPDAPDCNGNLIPDECEFDCQPNEIPDECDIIYRTSLDLNHNDVPDECEPQPCEATELDNLFASDGEAGDSFGEAVAIDGDTAVIGASEDDTENGDGSGSAYILYFDGMSWAEQARLLASDGTANDEFGTSVAIDGDVAVIGAHKASGPAPWSGLAYVYRRSGSIWVQEKELDAFDGGVNDNFGYSVGVSGDVAVIGARCTDDILSGLVYVFRDNGGNWGYETTLLPSDGWAMDWFGCSVAISGDTVVIGACNDDDNGTDSGSAYVFRFDGADWLEEAKLLPSDGAENDQFGISVAIDGDAIVIGAHQDDDNGADSGSAYVFVKPIGGWASVDSPLEEDVKLLPSDGANNDRFGNSVGITGDTAVIGAPVNDGNATDSGSAYVFVRPGGGWGSVPFPYHNERAKVVATNGDAGDEFGCSVAISGESALVGARLGDGQETDSGSAYVVGALSNCNNNDTMDICEITEGTGEDCQPNGILDECDIAEGTSLDCLPNGIPDECEPDCQPNGVTDECDIYYGTSLDDDGDGIPDECDNCYLYNPDQVDCQPNGVGDVCEIAEEPSLDVDGDGIPNECDNCDLDNPDQADCQPNGVGDVCDIAEETSDDYNQNDIPDECDPDCNINDVPDDCDIYCEVGNCASDPNGCGESEDCNANDIPDECDIANGTSEDCNFNEIPDDCDIAYGTSLDLDGNGIPDECEVACCFSATSCADLAPDECTLRGGTSRGPGTSCPTQNVATNYHEGPDMVVVHWTDAARNCYTMAKKGPRSDCAELIDAWVSAARSDCCDAQDFPGCDDIPCEAAVCALDAYCCSEVWDGVCADLAAEECGELCDAHPICHHFGDAYAPYSPPIPADFFGAGSDPYGSPVAQQVCLRGEPLGETEYGYFEAADTLIWREGDPFERCDLPSGEPSTVDIEIVALNLKSIAPITVTYNGGKEPELWDVAVDLSVVAPAYQSTLTAYKTHCNGGTYETQLYVQPKFTFTKVGGGDPEVLDTGLWGFDAVPLAQNVDHWVADLDPNMPLESEWWCTDFHPGIEDPNPMTDCDCNDNGIRDKCDMESCPPEEPSCQDCQANGVPDGCDITDGTSLDVDDDGIPDECDNCYLYNPDQADCQPNGVGDVCDAADCAEDPACDDCNGNGILDQCDIADCAGDPACDDCNGNGVPDQCDLDDCAGDPDCDDCNENGIPDECEVPPIDPDAPDCNANGVPDECETDCQPNTQPDECDIADCTGEAWCDDCNNNGVPDQCDIESGTSSDGDDNGIPDECEQECTTPPPDMVAWWPLDEQTGPTAHDIVGGKHSTHMNGPTPLPGFVGGALSFDGTDDYVEGLDDGSLDFGMGEGTVDAWIRTTSEDVGTIVAKGAGLTYVLYSHSYLDGRLTFEFCDDAFCYPGPETAQSVNDGNWHHVAVTLSRHDDPPGAVTVDIYLDSVLDGTNYIPYPVGPIGGLGEELLIGASPSAQGYRYNFFDGVIDEVEIFNRALEEEEILAIYLAGTAGKCKCVDPPADMLSWWTLDEPAGPTAYDIAGDNDGTHLNGPTPLPAGKVGGALSFDGTDDYVEVLDQGSLDFGMGEGTIDAWIRTDADHGNIVVKGSWLWYYFMVSNGHLRFGICDEGACWMPAETAQTVNDSNWHHVAATLTRHGLGDVTLEIYIDGVSDATMYLAGAIGYLGSPDQALLIGTGRNASGNLSSPFDGDIDEVEIFNRALDEEEILAIYLADSAGKCRPLVPPDAPANPVHQARKHRYISIDPSTNADAEVALKVELVEMTRCAGDLRRTCSVDVDCPNVCDNNADTTCSGDSACSGGTCALTAPCVHHPDEGLSWWVQEPEQEPRGCRLPGGCTDEDWFARLDTTPVFRAWDNFGVADSSLLHIGDCQMTPVATYAVSACVPPEGSPCSDAFVIGTILRPPPGNYGDVVGPVDPVTAEFDPPNQILSVGDISGYLLTNLNYGLPGDPMPQAHWTWIDLIGSGGCAIPECNPPNGLLNITDLQYILRGLQGLPWRCTPGECQCE